MKRPPIYYRVERCDPNYAWSDRKRRWMTLADFAATEPGYPSFAALARNLRQAIRRARRGAPGMVIVSQVKCSVRGQIVRSARAWVVTATTVRRCS